MSSSRPMQDGNGVSASATAGSTSSSTTNTATTGATPHSHAMRAYVTEPGSAGNRNAALHGSQPRPEAEVVKEFEMRMQMQLDDCMRKLSP
ncbi:uncharacterized protein PG986_002011 [Apiospora aurea]|uniref:Uncharacterized protein n=1 Tax=Apiospora aurea TaxID=335848 RepID=A0ABR1QYM3_9PEZI